MSLILIPPSEGKESGGEQPALETVSLQTQEILQRLKAVPPNEQEKLLGVKGAALEQAIKANESILKSKTLPAIKRYTGVVYKALDYPTLNPKEKTFLNERVRIISPLFGLVQLTDLIPNYKLKIDKLGCQKYWLEHHSNALKDQDVIDLLPQAHAKSISYSHGRKIHFYLMKNNKKTPAGHQGKHIKGRFIRYLAQKQSTSQKTIESFQEDGFVWDGKESFIKNLAF